MTGWDCQGVKGWCSIKASWEILSGRRSKVTLTLGEHLGYQSLSQHFFEMASTQRYNIETYSDRIVTEISDQYCMGSRTVISNSLTN